MTTNDAGVEQRPTERRPWTVRVGLVLLWITSLCLAGLMALMAVFFVATIGLPGALPSPLELAVGALTLVGTLAMLVVLIFATRGKPWARWSAAVAGITVGGLALLASAVTQFAVPETVALSLTALIGGVLLMLPTSRPSPAGRPSVRQG